VNRPPSFQFYFRDWMSDPVVQAMSWDQRGRFHWALCCSWCTDEPGVADETQWQEWMGYSDEEWVAVRPKIVRAFKFRRDGVMVQKRAVEEREAQRRRNLSARKGADATNVKRWGSVANDTISESLSVSPSFASASASAKESSLPPPTSCAEPNCVRSTPSEFSLPLNDKTQFSVSEEQAKLWEGLYPAVDVPQTLREMIGWLDANPSRRKTRRGILRFCAAWLSREQDKG
jgi:uncharacterized protein YdaU (DUF1376 family)